MEKKVRSLMGKGFAFSGNYVYREHMLETSSKWSFILRLPSVKRELAKIANGVNHSLFLKWQYLRTPSLVEAKSIRFILATDEMNNTIIELKLFK